MEKHLLISHAKENKCEGKPTFHIAKIVFQYCNNSHNSYMCESHVSD